MTMTEIPLQDIPAVTCVNPEHATLVAELEDLRRVHTELQALNQRQVERINNLTNDINMIGEVLQESAEEYDYCSVYDSKVDYINSRIRGGVHLPTRSVTVEREFRVTVSWTASGVTEDELYDDLVTTFNNVVENIHEHSDYSLDDADVYFH